jgi:1,4-dihydroxy-2-naphthoate octaprenyltransferase
LEPTPSTASVWILAARPKTLFASIAPVLIGIAMAYSDGGFHGLSALVALACAILIQIAANFANDLFDFEKGADTELRQGPVRVTHAGWVAPETMKRATLWVIVLIALGGLYLVWRGGWPIALIGVFSVAAGLLYTGGPYPLGYMGLGDVLVLIFFGPVAVAGTYYVQTLSVTAAVLVAGLSPGLLSVAILTVNNARDMDEDLTTGKRTLVVRFGRGFACAEYISAVVLACLLPLLLYLVSGGHVYSVAAAAVVFLAVPMFRKVCTSAGPALNPVLASTAKLLLIYSALFSLGWIL